MSDCIFCRIVAGQVPAGKVYEDDRMVVFRDIAPKAAVHLVAVPRAHIASLEELKPEHDGLIGHMLRMLPPLAREQGLDSGFRTIINTGKGGGQEIFHLHVHLLGGDSLPGF
jgi:histidine triad (HIT) family protein